MKPEQSKYFVSIILSSLLTVLICLAAYILVLHSRTDSSLLGQALVGNRILTLRASVFSGWLSNAMFVWMGIMIWFYWTNANSGNATRIVGRIASIVLVLVWCLMWMSGQPAVATLIVAPMMLILVAHSGSLFPKTT